MNNQGTKFGHSNFTRSESPTASNLRCIPSSKNAKFIIGAEFDNKIGSVVKHQIPRKIPGFKENLENLGELMIPLNTELKTNADYSSFILYKDSKNQYNMFPDSDKDLYGSISEIQRLNIHEIGTIYESQDSNLSEDGTNSNVENDIDDILFFICVSKTIRTNEDERGAKIKSIAIGTPLRNFIVFKHLLTIAIHSYIQDGSIVHLISLFNVINSTDISVWQKFMIQNHELYKNLSLSYEFNNRLILSNFKNIPTKDVSTQSVKYKNGTLQYYSSLETNDSLSSQLKLIPLNFSLESSRNEIISDLNLNSKILKFIYQLASKLNQLNYKNFKVIIYSNNMKNTTDTLCQFILSMSNFLNGFGNPYFSNDKILYFPLIDLAVWDDLLKFDKSSKNSKIIGTNNIILKDSGADFYDFWYDLDSNVLEVSEKLKLYDDKRIINKTYYFQQLLSELITKKHDSSTVLLSLKKFNIWQIIQILNRDLTNEDENELNIKDYYLSVNKNLITFNEFFEFKTIELIEKIDLFLTLSEDESTILIRIPELISIYKYFLHFISISNQNIGNFLFILEIFPTKNHKFNIKDLLFDVKDIQSNKTENSLINLIFRFILVKNLELQKLIFKIYELFRSSTFKLILDERLNIFIKLLIDEYSQDHEDLVQIKTNFKKKKKKRTKKLKKKPSIEETYDNYI